MKASAPAASRAAATDDLVTFRVGRQWLGLPVATVQEVLTAQRLAPVPLAPPAVAGFLNLRGQIVTAIDLRTALGEPPDPSADAPETFDVVVRDDDELFALVVDGIGDVITIAAAECDAPPATLAGSWAAACAGAVRRERDVLLILDLARILRADA